MLKAPTYISYNTKPSTECTIQDRVCYYCSLSPQSFKYILRKTLIHRHSHIFSLTHTWTHTHTTPTYIHSKIVYMFLNLHLFCLLGAVYHLRVLCLKKVAVGDQATLEFFLHSYSFLFLCCFLIFFPIWPLPPVCSCITSTRH